MEWHRFEQTIWRPPAPSFSLPSVRGGEISTRHYRNRSNLLLCFLRGPEYAGSRVALEFLAGQHAAYLRHESAILALLPVSLEQLLPLYRAVEPPFPLLADTGGRVRAAYASILGSEISEGILLFLLDRYGAPFAALDRVDPLHPTLAREVEEWLAFIELQCPE